jgi:hypothetical protein
MKTERRRPGEQPLQRLLRITEPFHVRQEAAGLDGEEKICGHSSAPRRERSAFGKTVEGIVHLDGIEP